MISKTIDLNNNNPGNDDAATDDDLETMIHAILVAWWDEYKQKLSKEVMLIAQHAKRWCDWCMPEDQKKEIKPFLLMKSSIKFLALIQPK